MVLWLWWWWWWLTGCLAQSRREKHIMFSIIHEKKSEQLHKIAQVQWWLSFRCSFCVFFLNFDFVRFKLPFLLHFLSFSLSLFLAQKSFFFYFFVFDITFFFFSFFASMCCIAWWQRMTMVFHFIPTKREKKNNDNEYNISDVIV